MAIYDYAKYNEEILGNKSYIICFTENAQRQMGFPTVRHSYNKFDSRFHIITINNIDEMSSVINKFNLQFFYTQTGGGNDIYKFNDKSIWGNCKTIKHCVFDTKCPESDYYISISECLNVTNQTNIPVIPYIVDPLPNTDDNFRNELKIPIDAVVFGRYGGESEFNIPFAHEAIKEYLNIDNKCYFVFMNTNPFYKHDRIIYLDKNVDLLYKSKFINTCDDMIHARAMGETFGLAIAEFSMKNKPIITCPCGDLEHIKILGDKAIKYSSKEELLGIFQDIKNIANSKTDWNAYREYSAENIMKKFDAVIFS